MGLEEGCRRALHNDRWLEETNSFWLGFEGALWLGWDKGCSWKVLVVADEKECRMLSKYGNNSGVRCTRVKRRLVSEVSYPYPTPCLPCINTYPSREPLNILLEMKSAGRSDVEVDSSASPTSYVVVCAFSR
jgi:hypothetical protein